MQKISEAQWLAIKQSYPIGCKFSAQVCMTKPFGTFVIIERSHPDCLGLIEIVRSARFRDIIRELPFDYSKRPQIGTEIDCIVCSYRDRNKQLGLGWLNSKL